MQGVEKGREIWHIALMLPAYTLVKTKQRRRSIAMTLRPDGMLEVRAPHWVNVKDVERFIQQRLDWVEKQQKRQAQRAKPILHHYTNGDVFYLDGEALTLQVNQGKKAIQVTGSTLQVSLPDPQPQKVAQALVKFYKAEALARFEPALADLAHEMGEHRPIRLEVSSAERRWGSCTDRGRVIRLSYRLVMAPPLVQDYVMVHELAHLEHMNHSAAFWAKVEAFCPNYEAHEKALKHFDSAWVL